MAALFIVEHPLRLEPLNRHLNRGRGNRPDTENVNPAIRPNKRHAVRKGDNQPISGQPRLLLRAADALECVRSRQPRYRPALKARGLEDVKRILERNQADNRVRRDFRVCEVQPAPCGRISQGRPAEHPFAILRNDDVAAQIGDGSRVGNVSRRDGRKRRAVPMPVFPARHSDDIARRLVQPRDFVRRINIADQRHRAVSRHAVQVCPDNRHDAIVKVGHGPHENVIHLGEVSHAGATAKQRRTTATGNHRLTVSVYQPRRVARRIIRVPRRLADELHLRH